MRNLGSGFGHQEIVSTEAVVGVPVVDGEEDDEDECLWLFENSLSVDTFCSFPDNRPPSSVEDLLEGNIV